MLERSMSRGNDLPVDRTICRQMYGQIAASVSRVDHAMVLAEAFGVEPAHFLILLRQQAG